LFKNSEKFESILPKKYDADIETHKSGDMQATVKGKVIGYFFESEGLGYVFETPKEFANFMKMVEKGEFEAKEKPEKTEKKGKKQKTAPKKGRKRRTPSDASDEKEPDIDLDDVVDEDASPATNAHAVFQVLKKEIKRLKVKSENVSDLTGIIEDYLKLAKKEKTQQSPKKKTGKKAVSDDSDANGSDSSSDTSD